MIRLLGQWIGIKDIAEGELKRLRKTARVAVLKAELHYEGAVKKKLSGPRSGRIYMIGKRRNIPHQASAPGEPPASMLGSLRKSITHQPPVWNGDEVSGEVGASAPHARILEYGGWTGRGHLVRILPRPYWGATFLEEEGALNDILAEAVYYTVGST